MEKKKPDISIFYSLACLNLTKESAAKDQEWGSFISPQPIASDACEPATPCSDKYYQDCLELYKSQHNAINHLVIVGCQDTVLSQQLAGLMGNSSLTLDLVDIDKNRLLTAFQKINTSSPQVISRVKLFFGDLPIYIKNVTLLSNKRHLIYYQASSNFNDVVRDLGATSFCKANIMGVALNNCHLRTTDMNHYAFADVALYALFSANIQFLTLGNYEKSASKLKPLANMATYYAAERVDGFFIPYAANHFYYPHPHTELESFLYKPEEVSACIN